MGVIALCVCLSTAVQAQQVKFTHHLFKHDQVALLMFTDLASATDKVQWVPLFLLFFVCFLY